MGERARILVVDDDERYAVDVADSGKQAIDKSNEEFYNLALVDIRLPGMEGTELLTKMKVTTPKMRKIIITGYPTLQNAVKALNKGADAYIMKPFDMDKVLKTIKEQLKKQEEEKKYNQEKVTEFIETRVKELEEEKTITHKKPR
jgi:DNA-binding NtrC family response regulator